MAGTASSELLPQLDPILPLVAEAAHRANADRRPDQAVFRALAEAGLLRLLAPTHYGGHGVHPDEFASVVQAVARVDGSTAWSMMTINEELGIASAWLQPEPMCDLLRDEPNVIVAGSGVPGGRAEPRPGGWLVSGRWLFVSGCTVADRIVVSAWVERNGDARPGRGDERVRGSGREMCFVLVPVSEVRIEDTWHMAGLAGTGSHDVVLDEVFVPDRWAGVVSARAAPTVPDTPFYRLPSSLRFCVPKVGVAHGIARNAIETFTELATAKKPRMHQRSLADRPFAQSAMAEAEALVGSGRAWVSAQVAELWDVACANEPIPPELHARVRLACSRAVDSSIKAVALLADAAGTTAGATEGPWPRLLADVRAVAQHYMVAPYQMDTAGRVLLGCDPDDPLF